MTKEYDPYKIGKKLYHDGLGVSDIWGAVKHDNDMDACYQGYLDAKWMDEKKQNRKHVRSHLGYSRIGRYGK
jgi:hypothetical protein